MNFLFNLKNIFILSFIGLFSLACSSDDNETINSNIDKSSSFFYYLDGEENEVFIPNSIPPFDNTQHVYFSLAKYNRADISVKSDDQYIYFGFHFVDFDGVGTYHSVPAKNFYIEKNVFIQMIMYDRDHSDMYLYSKSFNSNNIPEDDIDSEVIITEYTKERIKGTFKAKLGEEFVKENQKIIETQGSFDIYQGYK